LKKAVEKLIDSRFDERLAKIKHELDLDQEKMSVVYENQKDSFRERFGGNAQRDGGYREGNRWRS
jgi:hypothetical protein